MSTIEYTPGSEPHGSVLKPDTYYIGNHTKDIFYASKDGMFVNLSDGLTSRAYTHNAAAFERIHGKLTITQS